MTSCSTYRSRTQFRQNETPKEKIIPPIRFGQTPIRNVFVGKWFRAGLISCRLNKYFRDFISNFIQDKRIIVNFICRIGLKVYLCRY